MILPVITDIGLDSQITLAWWHFIDWWYQVRKPSQSEDSLQDLDKSLKAFQKHIEVFKNVSKSSLNFPKLHSMTHYSEDIQLKGTPDNFTTEHSE